MNVHQARTPLAAVVPIRQPESYLPALRHTVVDAVARHLVGAREALDETDRPWDDLSGREQAQANFVARGAIRSLDAQWIEDAELRARQALAHARFGREFHLLTPTQMRSVYHEAKECCAAYRTAIEGISSPLHPEERAQLTGFPLGNGSAA